MQRIGRLVSVGNQRGRKEKQYLVMYDSGYLAVVTHESYYTHISPLDTKKWKVVYN